MFNLIAERNKRTLRRHHGWLLPDEPDSSNLEVAELEGLPEDLVLHADRLGFDLEAEYDSGEIEVYLVKDGGRYGIRAPYAQVGDGLSRLEPGMPDLDEVVGEVCCGWVPRG